MGMQMGGKGPQSEINVTPLVDVVLVLLIIFMVISPMLNKVIHVEVPEESDSELSEPPEDQVVLRVEKDGSLLLNKSPVEFATLDEQLWKVFRGRGEKVIFLDAHDEANFDRVVQVMDAMRSAGIPTIGIVTVSLEAAPAPATEDPAL